MKLNNVEVNISMYTSEMLDNDMVFYCEQSHKITVLNHTAVLVWESIVTCDKTGTDLSTEDIANMLVKQYCLLESELASICMDVDVTIELLYKSSLLVAG